jgi:cob(I)alamin adenosyltransferase
MAHRLSKIATRTGDGGETGLGDGSRLSKDSARVRALGDIDELSSAIGLVLAEDVPPAMREALAEVQQHLFDLGGEISIPGHALLTPEQVAHLNRLSDLLFVAARALNRHAGRPDVQWRHDRKKP